MKETSRELFFFVFFAVFFVVKRRFLL